jgi:8-oxo-dGTP pyrophosphatase MutT (NUDIX family)
MDNQPKGNYDTHKSWTSRKSKSSSYSSQPRSYSVKNKRNKRWQPRDNDFSKLKQERTGLENKNEIKQTENNKEHKSIIMNLDNSADSEFNGKEKTSLGIACCRINGNKPEILLVCKRYTYAYNIFVHGRYASGNNAEIIGLFNNMTIEEKTDILSLNFAQIWYRIWLNNTQRNANYFISKNKFESTFSVDNGARLKKLISRSSISIGKIWEIPKGKKKNKNEADIHCAIREFAEETNIHKKHYKIFPMATRSYTYVDEGCRYTNIYYLAFMRQHIVPRINFDNQSQLDEISDLRFADIETIRLLDSTGRLEKFVKPIFNYIKKKAK